MKNNFKTPQKIQEEYYKRTAHKYNLEHCHEKDEHMFALHQLVGILDFLDIKSILDVGSGTGRSISFFNLKVPEIKCLGIEPVEKLRKIGHDNNISEDQLVDGNALNINFPNNSFDLVCEFGVLHHVKNNQKMVDEMLRVSKKAIFISDANNFGAGSFLKRSVKQFLNFSNLWKFFNFVRTRGKMYMTSEGDGLFYPYSVFDNYSQIKKKCKSIHFFNTMNASANLYKTSPHVTILGVK